MFITILCCIALLIVGGVLSSWLEVSLPITIAACLAGASFVAKINQDSKRAQCVLTFLAGLTAAILVVCTKNFTTYFLILAAIGFAKASWSFDCTAFDLPRFSSISLFEHAGEWYYDNLVDRSSSDALRATVVIIPCVLFYLFLGGIYWGGNGEIGFLAFIPAIYLLYRAILSFCVDEY